MMTPIDAVRFHSNFGDADYWLHAEDRFTASVAETDKDLSASRGAILGLAIGGLMWVGLIAGFRVILGI